MRACIFLCIHHRQLHHHHVHGIAITPSTGFRQIRASKIRIHCYHSRPPLLVQCVHGFGCSPHRDRNIPHVLRVQLNRYDWISNLKKYNVKCMWYQVRSLKCGTTELRSQDALGTNFHPARHRSSENRCSPWGSQRAMSKSPSFSRVG